MTNEVLLIVLSIGFVILILFVCVAIGAMIKILFDVKKITSIIRRNSESIGETVDVVSEKAKSFFTNSIVLDKIIPAILGIITAGMVTKKAAEEAGGTKKSTARKKKKTKSKIFVEEEID